MDIRQPPAEKELVAEIPAEQVDQIDEVVEYLKEQGKDATRALVVEFIVHQHLRSSRSAVKEFREWRRQKDD